MNQLITSQRKTIQYYKDLLEKETNRIKRYLIKKNIKESETDLNRLLTNKFKGI